MEAFLIISIFLLVLLTAAYSLRNRKQAKLAKLSSAPTAVFVALPADWPGPRGLFDNPEQHAALALAEAERTAAEARAALLKCAATGDLSVLAEACAQGGDELYQQALGELVRCVRRDDEALQRLVNHITQDDHWRANAALAAAVLARWQSAPERFALGELLHIAALSDDAAVFQQTAEAALAAWRAGCLGWASAHNLHALIESEYWILAPAARQSGEGFVLKRMLVTVRRELAAATPPASSS
ncbi:MAG: hypothetical protein HYR56_31865 [Acidobacteria bacterium]|nr:hypothetical protein [Acidobacteriota bacterium]MBI3424291.1 hypothetical protein [Acidobacteriota bacterium]